MFLNGRPDFEDHETCHFVRILVYFATTGKFSTDFLVIQPEYSIVWDTFWIGRRLYRICRLRRPSTGWVHAEGWILVEAWRRTKRICKLLTLKTFNADLKSNINFSGSSLKSDSWTARRSSTTLSIVSSSMVDFPFATTSMAFQSMFGAMMAVAECIASNQCTNLYINNLKCE